MFVNIYGTKVEVAVSDGGMFFDTETKNFSAKTLKGLEKKLKEAKPTNTRGVQVESADGKKKGMVLGRVTSSGWRRFYYRVRWDDGNTQETPSASLFLPTTDKDKADRAKLAAESEEARKAYMTANTKHAEHITQFSAEKVLSEAFPIK